MSEEIMALYRCDPDRNTACRKTMCFRRGGRCRATRKPECAARDDDGNLIMEPRLREKKACETARENGWD